MLSFLSKIIKFNNLLVIGVYKVNEASVYYSLTVKKKGDGLTIAAMGQYDSTQGLLKGVTTALPVLLIFDGKGVLNKKIDLKNDTDIAWKKNLDLNTIYYTEYRASDSDFLSFARKKAVDEELLFFKQNGFQVMDFHLGPLLACLLHKGLNTSSVASNGSVLEFQEDNLRELSKPDGLLQKEYEIQGQKLSQYHLPLYGAAIQFYVKQKSISQNTSQSISTEEILYKKAFTYFGAGMLIAFFLALLASYTLINHFSGENLALNQENLYSNQTYQNILDLEKQKEQKMRILNETGQLSRKFMSYYIYTLSASVPSSVRINDLHVFPLVKEIKQHEKVAVEANTLIVKGETADESSFDRWLEGLKKMEWINKFEIVSLKKDKKNLQQFEIKILVKDV